MAKKSNKKSSPKKSPRKSSPKKSPKKINVLLDDMIPDISRLVKMLRRVYESQDVKFKIGSGLNEKISKHVADSMKDLIKRTVAIVEGDNLKKICVKHVEHAANLKLAGFKDEGGSSKFVIRMAPLERLIRKHTKKRLTKGALEALRSIYERKATKLINALIKQSAHSGVKTIRPEHLDQIIDIKSVICNM